MSLFIYKHFLSNSPSIFLHVFIKFASYGLLTKPTCNTSKYGTNAFAAYTTASWNFFRKEFPCNNMRQISYSQNYFGNSYTEKYCKNLNF